MLCAVDYIFNLLCAFNCLQPMKKFVFSVASRATGRLQIKPSGSGDENGRQRNAMTIQHEHVQNPRLRKKLLPAAYCRHRVPYLKVPSGCLMTSVILSLWTLKRI